MLLDEPLGIEAREVLGGCWIFSLEQRVQLESRTKFADK